MISRYFNLLIFVFLLNAIFSLTANAQVVKIDSVKSMPENIQYIGYSSQPLWLVTSSVSSIQGSNLQKSFVPNIANALSGKLTGLTIVRGGAELGNDSPSLFSRGFNTYGTGTKPLVILDGFESSFEMLSSEEVESISLLKDASATAIYGSRGANGVLLVTTKRGEAGPLKVSFSTQQGFQNASRLPHYLGSYDYAKLYNEARANDGESALYTENDLEAYRTGSDPLFHPNVNWYNEILRKSAPISTYNLNFRGGDKTVRYFALINYLSDEGLYKNTKGLSMYTEDSRYSKFNFRANIDIKLTKTLTAALTLGGSVVDQSNPGGFNTDAVFNSMSLIAPNSFPVYLPNGAFGASALYSNPLGNLMETGFYDSNGRTLQSTFRLTQQLDFITKGLSLSSALSFNNFFKSYSSRSRQYRMYSITESSTGDIIYNSIGQNTSLAPNESLSDQWRNFAFQVSLNYNRTFGTNKIDALVLYNSDNYAISGDNLPFKHINLSGRLTFSNQDKYIGEFSFGYTGSENFPRNTRFGFFPALSLGWVISNEGFLTGNDLVKYLKLRGSYGMVGNDNIGGQRFMFDPSYSYSTGYYFGAQAFINGIQEGSVANPFVTWEKEKKANIGIEGNLFKQIDFSLDLFQNERYDILAVPYRDIPTFLGLALPNYNVGKVNNKGFEAMIKYQSKYGNDFQYYAQATMWYSKNTIKYNSELLQQDQYLNRTGRPVGQPYVLEAIGFFKDQADIVASPKQTFTTVKPGDIKYKDQNDDKVINQNDNYPLGKTSIPELTLGFNTGFNFKGFDLDLFFQAVTNRTVYLSDNYVKAFQNNGMISEYALGRWTPETASTATYPRLSASNNLNNYQPSTFWQKDGSFIKLRSIELGYTIPSEITQKVKIKSARIFINGTDLFSLNYIKYADPETLTGYPAVSIYSVGLKLQL